MTIAEGTAEAHFVETPCSCGDLEHCATVRYIADIRIAFDEIDRLSLALGERRTTEMAADGVFV